MILCPFYKTWKSMLMRAYSTNYHMKNPTYEDVTVCDDWHTFSNFKNWMMGQNWAGQHLDKDILVQHNKTYSSETCVFVHQKVNKFLLDCTSSRGDHPIGVSCVRNKYQARCSNPFTGKDEYLGLFESAVDANNAWKKKKQQLAVQLAKSELVNDDRVAKALVERF